MAITPLVTPSAASQTEFGLSEHSTNSLVEIPLAHKIAHVVLDQFWSAAKLPLVIATLRTQIVTVPIQSAAHLCARHSQLVARSLGMQHVLQLRVRVADKPEVHPA
jgi:hypothetical protein